MVQLSDDIRKRLSALNKGALKDLPLATAAELRKRAEEAKPEIATLDSIAPGNVTIGQSGAYWLIDRALSQLWEKSSEFHQRYCRIFDKVGISGTPDDFHSTWHPLLECGSKDIAYLDIETCGFTGTPVFLVGALHFDEADIRIKQFFARDYSEEGPMLQALWDFLTPFNAVVTFNGKTFDIPFIVERSFFHRVSVRDEFHHFDLLHEARRRWKIDLPNCKLQTLERYICRRERYGDIPGELIPQAYHDFVRTGDATQIRDILHHNALDLLTMAEIVLFALEGRDIWE